MVERLVQGHVVFVDEQHGLLTVVPIQQRRERFEAVEDVILRILLPQDPLQRLLIALGDPLAFKQRLHARNFGTYEQPQHAIGVLKRQPIHALERKEDHRELSHVLLAQRRFLRDRQTVEQRPVRPDLEKALEHAHVQRLAKPPRTGKQIYLSPVVQQVADQARLVDIIKPFFSQLLKAVDAHRQFHIVHTRPHFPRRIVSLQKDPSLNSILP